MKSILFFMVVCLALSIPAVWHILTPGYFPMHDDTQVARVYEMYKSLREGQFPVRWVNDLGYGYGYPIFNFYNPLPYYAGAGFMFLGLGPIAATKTMMVAAMLLSGICMFLLAQSALPRRIAFIAALLYVYASYHGVQMYVRGAVAETWAYALLPLVFWAFWRRRVIVGALALAALILSHNLTAFMSLLFFLLLMSVDLFQSFKRLEWKHPLLSIILALGLSAFFWLPAVAEAPVTRLSHMVFREFDPPAKHTVAVSQLWQSSWGYGGSSVGLDDGMSLQIGKINIIGSLAAIGILLYCYLVKKSLANYHDSKIAIFLVFGFLLSVFFMLPISAPIWNSFPVLSYIQFPWRFLTFASFFSSLLTGFLISILSEKFFRNNETVENILFFVFCLLFIVYSVKFFQPQFKYATTDTEQTSYKKLVWEVSRRSDEYLPLRFVRPQSLEEAFIGGNAHNQELLDEMKKPTTSRRAGNVISLVALMTTIVYARYGSRISRRIVA